MRIHYFRPDGNYGGWALYTWNASTENAVWCQSEGAITGTDTFGVYFDATVNPAQGSPVGDLGFIINNCAAGQIKDPGPDQHLQITLLNQAWVIHADATVFTTQPTPQQMTNAILSIEQAYWVDRTPGNSAAAHSERSHLLAEHQFDRRSESDEHWRNGWHTDSVHCRRNAVKG